MGIEIERKFLVDEEKMWAILGRVLDPKIKRYPDLNITQWYLNDNTRIRCEADRHQHSKFTLTMKSNRPAGEFTRDEVEQEISKDFYQIIIQFDWPKIRKERYFFAYGWTVDKFCFSNPDDFNDVTYLFLAEIELESEDEKIVMPEWVAEEVTHDKRYYNSYLAKNPYKNWSTDNE